MNDDDDTEVSGINNKGKSDDAKNIHIEDLKA